MPSEKPDRVPSAGELAASPVSSSPELRRRYWIFMAILAVPTFAFVVLQIAGAPIWIGVVLVTVVCAGLVAGEVRRGRQLRRRYRAGTSD
jgi:hypothetical protein